jgi:MerR family transcriptional regulator, redox-sensitive transcriptional activator SoxR
MRTWTAAIAHPTAEVATVSTTLAGVDSKSRETEVSDISHRRPEERLLTIGELSEATGTPATALRYYERRGLMAPAMRVGGQRRYDSSSVARLMVITFCRFAGLSLDDIAEVVNDDSVDRSTTRRIAARQVDSVDEQIARLKLARRMMLAVVQCACPSPESCECGVMDPVIRRLQAYLDR